MNKNEVIRAYALSQLGSPYIYGATGQPCTPAYRRARQAQYPKYAEQMRRNCPVLTGRQATCAGCKYQGKLAFDCAQLTRRAAEKAGLSLLSGARSQFLKVNWLIKAKIEGLPFGQVAFLYRVRPDGTVPHTGIALGDGTFIHAKGHGDGVLRESLKAYPWTHFAVLRGQSEITENDSPFKAEIEQFKAIKIVVGKSLPRGENVQKVQERLLKLGYDIGASGADGIFGRKTEAAFKVWQKTSGHEADGIVTQALFLQLVENSEPPKEKRYRVSIEGLDLQAKDEILAKYPKAQALEM